MPDKSQQQLVSFLEQWKKLRDAVTEMGPYARMIREVEDIIDEDTDIKAELQHSKEEIKRLECVVQHMTNEFGQQTIALEKEHKLHLRDVNIEAKEAERKAGIYHKRLEESSQKALALEEELLSQRKQLFTRTEELEKLRSSLGLLELDDIFPARLEQLAMKIHAFAEAISLKDFENPALGAANQHRTFQMLVRTGFIDCENPIPISTSVASKHLRMAALEAVIATELSANIFQATPSYTRWMNAISPNPDWNTMAKKCPLQEAVLRSVSAVVYSRGEKDVEEDAIANIAHAISRKVRPLITDVAAFEAELSDLLRNAVHIWRATQRSPRRVIAITDAGACIDSPAFDIDEGIVIQGETNSERVSIITFPTIRFAATPEVLHSGYILRASNPLLVSGAIEAEHQLMELRRSSLTA